MTRDSHPGGSLATALMPLTGNGCLVAYVVTK
jgi:hypothetical protein